MMSNSHILIVDDEEDIRLTIQAALEAEGFKATTAATGEEALKAIGETPPDVVLLDIMMPDMDGRQVCRRIKESKSTKNIAVVFASALGKTVDRVAGLNIGADDYITKPYNMQELIAKIRAHCRIRESQRKLEFMVDFARSINSVEFGDISEAVLTKLDKIIAADRYSLFIVDDERRMLRVLAHNHKEDEMDELSLPFGGSLIMKTALKSGEIILLSDYPASKFAQGESRSKYSDGYTLCVPLKAGGVNLGVLNLSGNSKGYFDDLDHNTVELVRQMITASLNNARVTKELRRLATTDGLTRLYNHRHFHEILKLEYERASRYETQLSLVMMDIDYFKNINDTHGHPVGDLILKELARRLKSYVRRIDTLARYGGEEFAILLPQTSLDSARTLAERIRAETEKRPFETEKGELFITVSLGVCDTGSEDVKNHADIVSKADEALYRAKREGRNRTCLCSEGAPK